MSDDLVKRLRQLGDRTGLMYVDYDTTIEAADRIAKLEAALHQWDGLILHTYNGSRDAMSDMQDAMHITAALLHGDAPWPETRIEKLEAALNKFLDDWDDGGPMCKPLRKAMDAK